MSKEDIAKLEYINTPFAYTRQQQGLTLRQQDIMNRISAHLKDYFEDYWKNPTLVHSKDVPKAFLTDEQLKDLKPIRIELSELGVSSGTYARVKEAIDVILDIKLNGMVVDEEGEKTRRYNVVSYVDYYYTDHGTTVRKSVKRIDDMTGKEVSTGEYEQVKTERLRGYIDVTLNKDLVKFAFDMAQGYVSHPENIAQIGRVPNMPLMYYFVRHHMNNFKDGKDGKPVTMAKVELTELREYLGMTKKNAKGEVVQEKYPTYSQFKSKVLKVALDDIKRICDEGLINFYFTVKEIRPRGKQKGTPTWLVFEKVHVANEQDQREYRKASAKKLCNFLMEQYPTLDEVKLLQILTDVPADLWEEFKQYAYNGVPAAVERPHRWDGTHEDFVFYIMEQWIKQHQPKPEPVQTDLFAQELKPGEEEWQKFLTEYKGELLQYIGKFTFLSYNDSMLTLQCSEIAMNAFEQAAMSNDEARKQFLATLYKAYGKRVNIQYYTPKQ